VNSSIAFRSSIAIVLLLSIGWKLVIPPDSSGDLKDELVGFFERNDFHVVVTDESANYMPIIRITAASCQLQVARLTYDGSNRDLIRHLTPGADRSFIVFRGSVYTQQPIFWTVLDYVWSRFLRELGFVKHISPVIHVAESSSCKAEELPWGEIQGRSQKDSSALGISRDPTIGSTFR
jgi:hypothetical protein